MGCRFVFKKMVECGMPKFAHNKSLHILIADCDFPDCVPYFYNKVRRPKDIISHTKSIHRDRLSRLCTDYMS